MTDRERAAIRELDHRVAATRLRLGQRRDEPSGRSGGRWPWRDVARAATASDRGAFRRTDGHGRLATDLAWVHVVAQSEILRMAHLAVRRPLGEGNLDDDLRPRPMWTLVRHRARRERRRARLPRTQESGDARELALAEPRPDVRHIDQLTSFPDTDEQRAEVRATPATLRPAADYALLPAQHFDLSPRAAATSRFIWRIKLLGDEAFPAVREDVAVERASVARLEVGQTQQRGTGVAEDTLEARPPRRQRQGAHVVIAVAQDVEGHERHRLGAFSPADVAFRREMNPSLQPLKARRLTVLVQRDDLAVEQDRGLQLAREDAQRANDLGKLGGLVVAEPGGEAHATRAAARLHPGERSDAIVLRLVGETWVDQRRLVQRGQHRARRGRLWHRRC